MLAVSQPNPVLVIKSPSDNTAQKQFLGYEWSDAKGSEGIIYTGGDTVYDIKTPLFDPNNPQNPDKINYYIQQNFMGLDVNIPAHLQSMISLVPLAGLLDFSRRDFDKTIGLNPEKITSIITNWDQVRLETVCEIVRGVTYSKSDEVNEKTNNIILTADNITLSGNFQLNKQIHLNKEINLNESKRLKKSDIFMCFASGSKSHLGKVAFIEANTQYYAGGFMGIIRVIKSEILPKYLFEIFNLDLFRQIIRNEGSGSNINNLSSSINQLKIPLPPLDVQQKIVTECEMIDQAVTKAEAAIAAHKASIESLIENLFGKYPNKKISEVALINPSKTEIRHIAESTIISFVEMASVSEAGFIENTVNKPLKDLRKGSYTYFAENDIIIAKITPCMENGKCALAIGLSSGLAMGSSEFHVFRVNEAVLNQYLFALLNREAVRKAAEQNMTGSSGHRRVPANFYADYKIPVPPLAIQTQLVAEIALLEQQIATHQTTINQAASLKQAVMQKFL